MPSTDDHRMADDPAASVYWERNFAEQMKRRRESMDMTQTDLARVVVKLSRGALKFHQQTIQRIETGDRPVRLNEAHIIARALDTDVETMASTTVAGDVELKYAVNRTRSDAGTLAQALVEAFQEWLDGGLIELTNELANRVDDEPDDPTGQQGEPATQWGLAWTVHVLDATHHLADAWEKLMSISGARPVEYEYGWETSIGRNSGALDALRQWHDRYVLGESKMVSDDLLNTEPDQLYDMFPNERTEESS